MLDALGLFVGGSSVSPYNCATPFACPYCGYGQVPMPPTGELNPDLERLANHIMEQQKVYAEVMRRNREQQRYQDLIRRSAYRKSWRERLRGLF